MNAQEMSALTDRKSQEITKIYWRHAGAGSSEHLLVRRGSMEYAEQNQKILDFVGDRVAEYQKLMIDKIYFAGEDEAEQKQAYLYCWDVYKKFMEDIESFCGNMFCEEEDV